MKSANHGWSEARREPPVILRNDPGKDNDKGGVRHRTGRIQESRKAEQAVKWSDAAAEG